MLVLNRKRGEEIVIDDNIVVTVVEIRGNRVKLGFTVPGDVRVQRHEVFVRMLDAADAVLDEPAELRDSAEKWPTHQWKVATVA